MLIEFDTDNKKLGEILYALAHSVITPEISIEYTVSDPEKYKDELLKNAIEDSKHKAKVGSLTVVSIFSLTKSLKTLIISMLLSFFIVKFVKLYVGICRNVWYNSCRR